MTSHVKTTAPTIQVRENKTPTIAVIIPCYNEEQTIASVVKEFRKQLPKADIYVFDNNSTDNTVQEATAAGAIVGYEKRQGKGNVVRTMFKKINADVYVMVDGDSTYPADKVNQLINPILLDEADIVHGTRINEHSTGGFKPLNWLGNKLFLFLFHTVFRVKVQDLLTGYRAFSNTVAKSLPITSKGFELETELTAKAIEKGYRITEIPITLTSRPEGSKSKIKIVRDGMLITATILALFRDYKPFTAFTSIGLVLFTAGLIPGLVVVDEYLRTGYILRIPSAILAVGLVLASITVIFSGFVVHTITRRFQELESQMQSMIEMHLNGRK